MPVVLFWVIIIVIVLGALPVTYFVENLWPIFCVLIIAGFLIYIHYMTGSSVLLPVTEGQVVSAVPGEGVNITSHDTFASLVASGFLFWIVVGLAIISGFVCWVRDKENIAFSTLVFASLVLAIMEMGLSGFANFLWGNLWTVAMWLGLYVFVAAPLVAILKWYFFNIDHGEEHLDRVQMFQEQYSEIEIERNGSLKNVWEGLQNYKNLRPRNYKAKIAGWMMYWPLYLVDMVLRKFLWKVFKRIYQLLLPAFDRISRYSAVRVQRELDSLVNKK